VWKSRKITGKVPRVFDWEEKRMGKGSSSLGDKCFKTGLWGSIVAAICCFSPLLVVLLGFIGLSAIAPYLDYILFPLLVVFFILAFYGWSKRKEETPSCG